MNILKTILCAWVAVSLASPSIPMVRPEGKGETCVRMLGLGSRLAAIQANRSGQRLEYAKLRSSGSAAFVLVRRDFRGADARWTASVFEQFSPRVHSAVRRLSGRSPPVATS